MVESLYEIQNVISSCGLQIHPQYDESHGQGSYQLPRPGGT